MEKIIPKDIAKKILLGFIISLLIIPALMEYFKLSLTLGIALTSFVNLFVEVIMRKLELKIEQKIDKL